MLERVSYHAVIRYLERVLGLPVAGWLSSMHGMSESERCAQCCIHADLPIDAVKLSMLTEPVLKAMQARSRNPVQVVTHDATFVIQDGKIITVLAPDMRPYRKRKYKAYKSRQLAEV